MTATPSTDKSLENLITYPLLTRETADGGAAADGLSRTGIGGGLGRSAQDTIRAVLGWRYRGTDVKGFVAALKSTAVAKIVDGHTEWEWRSPSFMVQADLGEVTGAQASLMTRVKSAVAEIAVVMDRLVALRADADREDVDSTRALITGALEELVEEVALLGGPRVPRIDGIFWVLLGGLASDKKPLGRTDPYFKSHLGQLEIRLGLEEERVNTIEEERSYTDFIILSDLLLSLHQTWLHSRPSFMPGGHASLGTVLVQLSRYLDVIVESVHEAYAAMDSVFFGPAERAAFQLDLLPADTPYSRLLWQVPKSATYFTETVRMTVGDLLTWIEQFAANDARRQVREGGRDGAVAVVYTLARLYFLTDAAARLSESGNMPMQEGRDAVSANRDAKACGECHGFYHPRVARVLCEVACYLGKAASLDLSRYLVVGKLDAQPLFHNYRVEGDQEFVLEEKDANKVPTEVARKDTELGVGSKIINTALFHPPILAGAFLKDFPLATPVKSGTTSGGTGNKPKPPVKNGK